jgi:uncharacterized protein YukE
VPPEHTTERRTEEQVAKTFEADSAALKDKGQKVLDNAEQIGAEVEGLIGRLQAVDWVGTAADGFRGATEDWRLQVVAVKQQLADVAGCLGVTGSNYEAAHEASRAGFERLRGQNLTI